MTIEIILGKLDKVKRTAAGNYVACCPAHDDKHPSLSLRETDDMRVLVHCFSGCSVHEIVQAIGLEISDLFPPRECGKYAKSERRPFSASAVLRAIANEALVVCAAAVTLLSGKEFSQIDRERLILATSRIQAGLSAAGVQHV